MTTPAPPLDEDSCMTNVLAIIPDVEPEYLRSLIVANFTQYGNHTTERIIEALLDDDTYPTIDISSKRKRNEDDDGADGQSEPWLTTKYIKVDYGDHERPALGGVHYAELTLAHLQIEFPYVLKHTMRKALRAHNGFYAATYLFLLQEELLYENSDTVAPYSRRKKPFQPKGKQRALFDTAFERERSWVREVYGELKDVEGERDDDLECGCCFTPFKLKEMVQCPQAHLFCKECLATHASTRIGSQDSEIQCLDTSGCAQIFAPYELYQVLPFKLLSQYERINQLKEVLAAGLEGLEECPFCTWVCVIDSEEEKLLRCGNEEACGVVSCRKCKQVDHIPKTCEEIQGHGRRTIEEAMSAALVHKCPSCKKSFIKDGGCNQMTCQCGASSCYACRRLMRYHTSALCRRGNLTTESLHRADISEAKQRAIQEYQKNHPDVDPKLLDVEVP